MVSICYLMVGVGTESPLGPSAFAAHYEDCSIQLAGSWEHFLIDDSHLPACV